MSALRSEAPWPDSVRTARQYILSRAKAHDFTHPRPMPRKQKTSLVEDFMELISLLPWWMGLIIGAIGYFVLHSIAIVPVEMPTVTNVRELGAAAGEMYGRTLLQVFAQIGQYIVPALCVPGAIVSAVRRSKRASLLNQVAGAGGAGALNSMTWQEFEQMVGEWFRRQGYGVVEHGGGGADGGVDLVLRKDGEKFLVQCKQWRATRVGVSVVRELYGVMAAEGAAGGFVVTSGSFTDEAQKFARGRNLQLLDGKALLRMLATRSPAPKPQICTEIKVPGVDPQQCPACGSLMVRRIAKRGGNAGQPFLGCSGYPACKITMPL